MESFKMLEVRRAATLRTPRGLRDLNEPLDPLEGKPYLLGTFRSYRSELPPSDQIENSPSGLVEDILGGVDVDKSCALMLDSSHD